MKCVNALLFQMNNHNCIDSKSSALILESAKSQNSFAHDKKDAPAYDILFSFDNNTTAAYLDGIKRTEKTPQQLIEQYANVTPVGDDSFVAAWSNMLYGVPPAKYSSIPECLRKSFLHHSVVFCTDENYRWESMKIPGHFVKVSIDNEMSSDFRQFHLKKGKQGAIELRKELEAVGKSGKTPIVVSQETDYLSRWKAFVCDDTCQFLKVCAGDADCVPSRNTIKEMIQALKQGEPSLSSYILEVEVTRDVHPDVAMTDIVSVSAFDAFHLHEIYFLNIAEMAVSSFQSRRKGSA